MNKRYVPGNKALDLSEFGADKTFGGSSNAIGRLTDERVMDVVIDTIAEHLSDLQALNLSNNNLRTLRSNLFSKHLAYNILYVLGQVSPISDSTVRITTLVNSYDRELAQVVLVRDHP